jgi:hypothetical protein
MPDIPDDLTMDDDLPEDYQTAVHDSQLIPSHKYWGGLQLAHARVEFRHFVALREAAERVAPSLRPETVVPVDVGCFLQLPVWSDSGTAWVDFETYEMDYLGQFVDEDEKLSTLRTVARCDVRVSQLVNTILRPHLEDVIDWEGAILSSLSFLYHVHGESFERPNARLEPRNGSLGLREIFEFLSHAYAQNSARAERIIAKFAENSLRTIALVHALEGHLGGSRFAGGSALGGVTGGATSIRNIDLLGVLHDLDGDVFFPWCDDPVAFQGNRVLQHRFMSFMTAADLIHWKHTVHWFSNIVRGAVLEDEPERFAVKLSEFDHLEFVETGDVPPNLSELWSEAVRDRETSDTGPLDGLLSTSAKDYRRLVEQYTLTARIESRT